MYFEWSFVLGWGSQYSVFLDLLLLAIMLVFLLSGLDATLLLLFTIIEIVLK